LLQNVIAGPHARDHWALPARPPITSSGTDVSGLRIALSVDLGDWPVVGSVRDAVSKAAGVLADAGAEVDVVDLTVERSLIAAASDAHYGGLFGADLQRMVAGHEDQLNGYSRRWLDSLDTAPGRFVYGRDIEVQVSERVDQLFTTYDVLLCPAFAIPAFEAGVDYTEQPLLIDGVERDCFRDVGLTEVFNVANRCPALAVPAGRDEQGVPIGVQVVGPVCDDDVVFRVGAALEQLAPWPLIATP
jgi:aspartyl-tRNA(Asn)/glutamyl-tRNA(Gln) amidotransferase subunit A